MIKIMKRDLSARLSHVTWRLAALSCWTRKPHSPTAKANHSHTPSIAARYDKDSTQQLWFDPLYPDTASISNQSTSAQRDGFVLVPCSLASKVFLCHVDESWVGRVTSVCSWILHCFFCRLKSSAPMYIHDHVFPQIPRRRPTTSSHTSFVCCPKAWSPVMCLK
jgi:hypothetical protein